MSSDISIVVPMRNASATIETCLAHCIDQTLPPREVIVVDNNSNDDSVERVMRFSKDSPVEIRVLHCALAGPGPARNTAVAAVRGDYVAWVDADDWILPPKLERQRAALQSLKNQPAIASSDVLVERVDVDGKSAVSGVFTLPPTQHERTKALWGTRGIPPCGYLLTRSAVALLDETGGFLPVRCQDREYFARAHLLSIPFVHVPEVLSVYRNWSPRQVTHELPPILWGPALERCWQSLLATARARSVELSPSDEAHLMRSWKYLRFREYKWVSDDEIAVTIGFRTRRVKLDPLELAIMLRCGTQPVALLESLASDTCLAMPQLWAAFGRVLDAAIKLLERGVLGSVEPAAVANYLRAAPRKNGGD